MIDDTPYQPGSIGRWCKECDPGGEQGVRLAMKLETDLEGTELVLAIAVVSMELMRLLSEAPAEDRMPATDDILGHIRHRVSESLG